MQFDKIKLLFDSYVEGFRYLSNIVVVVLVKKRENLVILDWTNQYNICIHACKTEVSKAEQSKAKRRKAKAKQRSVKQKQKQSES